MLFPQMCVCIPSEEFLLASTPQPGSESYSCNSTYANKRLKWAQDRGEGTRECWSQNPVESWSRVHVHHRAPWGKEPENPERDTAWACQWKSQRVLWWVVGCLRKNGLRPYLHVSWVLRKRGRKDHINMYMFPFQPFQHLQSSSITQKAIFINP